MAFVIAMDKLPAEAAQCATRNRSREHTALSRAVQQYLNAIGAWSANIAGSLYQRAGLPDFLCFVRHPVSGLPVFFAVEVKTGKQTQSKSQGLRASQCEIKREIEQAGGIYVVATSVDTLHDTLRLHGLVLIDLLVR